MTNELEKQFFSTFGIEPKTIIKPRYSLYTEYYEEKIEKYPQITDSILLELILIIMHHEDLFGYPNNIGKLKDNTLKQLIEIYNKFSTCVTYDGEYQQMAMDIKHQVRTLFEEG